MWLYGFGFPRYRGGLMFWADQIGSREVYNQIAAWHQQYGDRWKPSALLRQLAESGTPFREAKPPARTGETRSEEHTYELKSLMRIPYAVFCLTKKIHTTTHIHP